MAALRSLAATLGGRFDAPPAVAALARYRLVHTVDPPLEAGLPPEAHLTSREDGLQLRLADGIVTTIFLFAEGRDGFREFRDPLGDGLTFACSQTDVASLFGPPAQSALAGRTLLGAHGGWCAYLRSDCRLHLEFRADGQGIGLVTLGVLERPPVS